METKKSNEDIDFKYNLKVYWEIMRKYKPLIFVIFFFIILEQIFEMVEKFLFKIVIDKGTDFSTGTLLRADFVHLLILIGVGFIIMQILMAINIWARHKAVNHLETRTIMDLKTRFFNHIMSLSHSFYTTHKTGSLISRLGRSGGALERMTDVFVFNSIPLVVQFVITVAAVIYFDWLSATIIGIIVLLFVFFSVVIQKLQGPSNIIANNQEDIEKANVSDIFTNIDSIKYFGKEEFIKRKFFGLVNKTRELFLKNWNYFNIMSSGQMIILGLGTFFLVYSSVHKFLLGQISIGTIVFIYSTYLSLLSPLFGFVYGIRNFYRSMADFQGLFQYGKIMPEIKNRPGAKTCNIKSGEINFKNISFSYGKRRILEDFNLRVNKNQKIALVGHSGSGKSTLVKLLYRFYDVESGSIMIDGEDIRDLKQESLREEMAIVPQECVLFDDTIYNNIAFSNPHAKRTQVLEAIKFAQLDKIISKFPKKENTIVGERGVRLSGGEKQRVSIARAILANKRILVLDEATSSLDSETEHEIQADLSRLMEGRTSIVIAHRLSTIMHADKIIVMKEGKIVQEGKHGDLINKKGEYSKLWKLQKGGYIR